MKEIDILSDQNISFASSTGSIFCWTIGMKLGNNLQCEWSPGTSKYSHKSTRQIKYKPRRISPVKNLCDYFAAWKLSKEVRIS